MLEISYVLRYPERRIRISAEQWSIRQVGIHSAILNDQQHTSRWLMLFPRYGSDIQRHIHSLLEVDHGDGRELSIAKNPANLHTAILVQLASNWQAYILSLEEELLRLVSICFLS